MVLVLARPGGGATTLLRLLSNQRKGYTDIEGDVRFGNMTSEEIRGYRGQVVMNGEEVRLNLATLRLELTIRQFLGTLLSEHDCRADHRVRNGCQDASRCSEKQEAERRIPQQHDRLVVTVDGDRPYQGHQGW